MWGLGTEWQRLGDVASYAGLGGSAEVVAWGSWRLSTPSLVNPYIRVIFFFR